MLRSDTTDDVSIADPEFVGAYSDPIVDYCCNWLGETADDVGRCEADATHTVVERTSDGEILEIAMCDGCGQPDDVDA